jgi:asparagine synthase (glutamine-hydrolysing)
VALSGESADEVFGGYRWFHQPEVQGADAFPWVTALNMAGATGPGTMPADMLDPELAARLDLPGYLSERYAEAAAEVEAADGEDEHEHRMRVMC